MKKTISFETVDNKLKFIKEPSKISEGVTLSHQESQYLLPHFTMMLIGKPGSGKTSLIKQLLNNKHMYKDKFDNILLISPSYAKMGLKQVPLANTSSTFNLTWIFDRLEEINAKQLQTQVRLLSMMDVEKGLLQVPGIKMKKLNLSVNGQPTHARIGSSADVFKSNNDLADRLFSGASRFFSATNRPIGGSKTVDKVAPVSTKLNLPHVVPLTPQQIMQAETQASQVKGQQQATDYEQLMRLSRSARESFYSNTLIILDDVVSDIKKQEYNPVLAQLFLNRRHLVHNGMVSLIVVSQKYSVIPSRIRSNANWLVLFRQNPVDQEVVYKDVINMHRYEWQELLDFVFKEEADDEDLPEDNAIERAKAKKYDNLGIFVELDLYFKNFKQIKAN